MRERDRFINWVKAHKKQLILAGISVTAIIGIILGLKNREAIAELWVTLENSLKKPTGNLPETLSTAKVVPPVVEEAVEVRSYTSPLKAFDVSQHIRNLSGGRHHSMEKAAEAAAMGIELLPNQTLVDSYTKCAA